MTSHPNHREPSSGNKFSDSGSSKRRVHWARRLCYGGIFIGTASSFYKAKLAAPCTICRVNGGNILIFTIYGVCVVDSDVKCRQYGNCGLLDMAYDGRAVANYVLKFARCHGRDVTNLSLQKIVYFCHVWSLIKNGKPLLKHQFEAWQFGPVVQYLYRDFRDFGDRNIDQLATQLDKFTGERTEVPCEFDPLTEDLLECVVDFYIRLTPSQLVALSHVEGGPWDQVWNHGGKIKAGMKIDDHKIVEFYSRIPTPFTIQ